jgi:hypothetical protein
MINLLIILVVVAIAVSIVRRLPGGCQEDCNQGRNCNGKCTKHDT